MMKRFTLTLMGLLLFLGGANSQTALELNGGNIVGNNVTLPSGDHPTSGTIRFQDHRAQYSYVTNGDWVDATAGTHTFEITLGSSGNEDCTLHIAALNEVVSGSTFDNGSIKAAAIIQEESITVTNNATLTLSVSSGYSAIILWQTSNTDYRNVNIASFTRTITTASSVAAPTISPASGTYDGDLSVTITKGDGNTKVVYSVSGATTGNATDAEFTENSKTLNLTGTGTITVTATGYEGGDASSAVVNTYTYSIPSGQSSTTSGHKFNSWDSGNAIVIDNSFFSSIETGDYVVLDVANVAQNGTVLGFRDSWNESPYSGCTTTSGGNGAKGVLNIGDTQWWMKVNSDVVISLKNHEVRMQGGMVPKETVGTEKDVTSSVDLISIKVYKSKGVSESLDNSLTKINDVVVELTRSFVADTWNTVCLPFDLTSDQATQLFGSGYQLAEYTDVSGTTLEFATAYTFEAGVPYLVKPTINVSNESPVVLFDVDITAKTPQTVTHDGYSFVGTFSTKTFSAGECNTSLFVAAGNELKKPENNSTLKSLRCYFTVPSGSIANARRFTIDDEEGGTTSINTVQGSGVMVNGYYNLNGQRVAKPTKGLFIVNGKKVVIK